MDGVRGARPLFIACALLIVGALLAAVTRPAVDDIAEARVETTPTTRRSTTTSSTTTTTSVVATADTAAPGTSAPRRGGGTTSSSTTEAPPVTEAPPATVQQNPALPTSRCGGLSLAKPTGGQWQCTLSEEFEGTSLNSSIWSVQTTASSGFHAGAECFMDDPDNVSVSNGSLKLTAKKENTAFTCPDKGEPYQTQWTSGMVMTFGKWAQTYGRFEIRAKMPAVKVQGLQTAFWMWPIDPFKHGPWPASGEIDIAEWFSVRPDYVVPYIHYLGGEAVGGASNNYCQVGAVEEWHTYTLEWYPDRLTILYDGKPCLTINPPLHPFHQPFTIALTQALGIGRKNGFVPDGTPLPATTEVDYVRAWR